MSEKKQQQTKQEKVKKTQSVKKSNPLREENKQLASKVINLKKKINDLQLEIQEQTNTYLKKAESFQMTAKIKVDDFKKKQEIKNEKEIANIKKYGIENFAKELLGPLLNLELAVLAGKNQNNPELKNYVIGFEMLLKQIEKIMLDYQISKISPKVGDLYDPKTMDVISVVENQEKNDMVIEKKKDGYKLHDRVIKPAVVVISKK